MKYVLLIIIAPILGRSPPRGEWIEIRRGYSTRCECKVAPPHGERGLKSVGFAATLLLGESLPPWGAWIEIQTPWAMALPSRCRSPCGECGLKLGQVRQCHARVESRFPRGERGLKYEASSEVAWRCGRSPHGERGLKYWRQAGLLTCFSRSPHGERGLKYASVHLPRQHVRRSLPPRGAWIEILLRIACSPRWASRSPRGERGLKYDIVQSIIGRTVSLPPRGAWIEIALSRDAAWSRWSLPPRGAWIEIRCLWRWHNDYAVAPPTGSVD